MDPIKMNAPSLRDERGSIHEIRELQEKVTRLESLQKEIAGTLLDLAKAHEDLVKRLRMHGLV